MAQYTLTYLDITGIAEVSRYLFAYGKIDYDDIRISFDSFMNRDEEYKEIKKGLPYGVFPTLEFDGRVVTQSSAIARYLAIKLGLYGNDPLESLLIDEAYGNIDDMRIKFGYAYYCEPAKKATLLAELKSVHMPYYLSRFEKIVGETGGHFAVPRWNLADFYFCSFLYYCNNCAGEDILQGYPNLQKMTAELEALPGIKDYLENRPKTAL